MTMRGRGAAMGHRIHVHVLILLCICISVIEPSPLSKRKLRSIQQQPAISSSGLTDTLGAANVHAQTAGHAANDNLQRVVAAAIDGLAGTRRELQDNGDVDTLHGQSPAEMDDAPIQGIGDTALDVLGSDGRSHIQSDIIAVVDSVTENSSPLPGDLGAGVDTGYTEGQASPGSDIADDGDSQSTAEAGPRIATAESSSGRHDGVIHLADTESDADPSVNGVAEVGHGSVNDLGNGDQDSTSDTSDAAVGDDSVDDLSDQMELAGADGVASSHDLPTNEIDHGDIPNIAGSDTGPGIDTDGQLDGPVVDAAQSTYNADLDGAHVEVTGDGDIDMGQAVGDTGHLDVGNTGQSGNGESKTNGELPPDIDPNIADNPDNRVQIGDGGCSGTACVHRTEGSEQGGDGNMGRMDIPRVDVDGGGDEPDGGELDTEHAMAGHSGVGIISEHTGNSSGTNDAIQSDGEFVIDKGRISHLVSSQQPTHIEPQRPRHSSWSPTHASPTVPTESIVPPGPEPRSTLKTLIMPTPAMPGHLNPGGGFLFASMRVFPPVIPTVHANRRNITGTISHGHSSSSGHSSTSVVSAGHTSPPVSSELPEGDVSPYPTNGSVHSHSPEQETGDKPGHKGAVKDETDIVSSSDLTTRHETGMFATTVLPRVSQVTEKLTQSPDEHFLRTTNVLNIDNTLSSSILPTLAIPTVSSDVESSLIHAPFQAETISTTKDVLGHTTIGHTAIVHSSYSHDVSISTWSEPDILPSRMSTERFIFPFESVSDNDGTTQTVSAISHTLIESSLSNTVTSLAGSPTATHTSTWSHDVVKENTSTLYITDKITPSSSTDFLDTSIYNEPFANTVGLNVHWSIASSAGVLETHTSSLYGVELMSLMFETAALTTHVPLEMTESEVHIVNSRAVTVAPSLDSETTYTSTLTPLPVQTTVSSDVLSVSLSPMCTTGTTEETLHNKTDIITSSVAISLSTSTTVVFAPNKSTTIQSTMITATKKPSTEFLTHQGILPENTNMTPESRPTAMPIFSTMPTPVSTPRSSLAFTSSTSSTSFSTSPTSASKPVSTSTSTSTHALTETPTPAFKSTSIAYSTPASTFNSTSTPASTTVPTPTTTTVSRPASEPVSTSTSTSAKTPTTVPTSQAVPTSATTPTPASTSASTSASTEQSSPASTAPSRTSTEGRVQPEFLVTTKPIRSTTPTPDLNVHKITQPAAPPSVFIEIELRMTWREFCLNVTNFIADLSTVILREKQVAVPHDMFRISNLTEHYCRLTGQVFGDDSRITIQLYVVNMKGKVDIELTIDCSQAIKKGFEASSIFKNKIVGAKLQGLPTIAPEIVVGLGNAPQQPAKTVGKMSGVTMVVTIAAVGGACCVVMIILQVILIQRRRRAKKLSAVAAANRASIRSINHVALGVIPKSRPDSGYWNPALDEHDDLSMTSEHSHLMNFSGLANFTMDTTAIHEEFQRIPCDMLELSVVPVGAEDKNRFANVLPRKETRVRLKKRPDGDDSDYINANYVSGYRSKEGSYIATQSPMVNTAEDFWRMVWEQQVRVILMINPVSQTGKPKHCTLYWPDPDLSENIRQFGDFTVTLKKKLVQKDYVECTLELRDMEQNLKRDVHHFWYTCWPDQGTPEPLSFVKFVLDTRPHYEDSGAPVVVHCGPGTGRSCCLIAVDVCMRMFENKRRVDIMQCVSQMRQERVGAVQTKEQYAFIYQALNEYAVILSSPSISTRSSVITLHAML